MARITTMRMALRSRDSSLYHQINKWDYPYWLRGRIADVCINS